MWSPVTNRNVTSLGDCGFEVYLLTDTVER